MAQNIPRRSPRNLRGEVSVSQSTEFDTDVYARRGIQRVASRGTSRPAYDIRVDFQPMYLGDPTMPERAAQDTLSDLIQDQNYPDFLRALADALEGEEVTPPAPSKSKRKAKAKAKARIEPKRHTPRRNIRFLGND